MRRAGEESEELRFVYTVTRGTIRSVTRSSIKGVVCCRSSGWLGTGVVFLARRVRRNNMTGRKAVCSGRFALSGGMLLLKVIDACY